MNRLSIFNILNLGPFLSTLFSRRGFIVLALVLVGMQVVMAAIIVDGGTGTALGKASVFDHRGNLVGVCSEKGLVPQIAPDAYPITIRCMGYEPLVLEKPQQGKIGMKEAVYDLPDIAVESEKHQVLLLVGYVREYTTLSTFTDTVLLFREKTVDFMIPSKRAKGVKGWLDPRVLASRSYYRFTNASGLDSVSDRFERHFSWSDWVGIPDRLSLPAELRNKENRHFTEYGLYSPSHIWKKNGENLEVDINVLADKRNRTYAQRLYEYTGKDVEITDFTIRYDFSDLDSDEILPGALNRMSFNVQSNGRKRNLQQVMRTQDPIYINTYTELYIIDRQYISAGQASKWEKEPPRGEEIGIYAPANAPELQAAIEDVIERVNNIDVALLRLKQEPDQRLVGKHFGKARTTGFKGKLKSLLGL